MGGRIAHRLEAFDSSVFQQVFLHRQRMPNAIDLSVGIPEESTPDHIKQAGMQAIASGHTTYTPTNGIESLRRELLVKLHLRNDDTLQLENVTVVPGLTTGLLIVYLATLNPHDHIITIDPAYPPYTQLAQSLGVDVTAVPVRSNFQLDVPAIASAMRSNTKLIVINSPNNPTGAIYPERDLKKIVGIADRHNARIVSDEIYEHFAYTGQHTSISTLYRDTISLYGFSKQYAMTGWRLGYVTGPADIIASINTLQQYTVFSSSSIAQHAALQALKQPHIVTPAYARKRDAVASILSAHDIPTHGLQGAYYAYIPVPQQMDDLSFADALRSHNVIVVPGSAFSTHNKHVRISYGGSLESVRRGVEILAKLHTTISNQASITYP